MNPFEVKSIFAWQVPSVLKGEPVAYADLLAKAGFESVGFKVGDGAGTYGASVSTELIAALRARKVLVWGWGFLYGVDWKGEARVAAAQVNRLGLDGYIWDVEGQYEKTPNAVQNAYNILAVFKNEVAKATPTAFCSWAYWKNPRLGTAWHPVEVLKAFMDGCDYGMPMQYWQGNQASGAVSYCKGSLTQWRKYTQKPIIPVGRAYNGDGGEVTAEATVAYERAVRDEGCKGISWWVLDQAQPKYHTDLWNALSLMPKFGNGIRPEPPSDPPAGDDWKARYEEAARALSDANGRLSQIKMIVEEV